MKKISTPKSSSQNRLLLNNPNRDFNRVNRKLDSVGPVGLSRVGKRADEDPTTKTTETAGIIKTSKPPTFVGGNGVPLAGVPVKAPKGKIAAFIGK